MTAGFGDHLNLDAIVAFADGEMPMTAFQRAAAHVARCPQCDNEVNQQIAARLWLRSAGTPAIPLSLLDSLRSIPVALPPDHPSDGPGVDPASGRPLAADAHAGAAHHRQRRFRFLGAGVFVAGLAVGALAFGADQPANQPGSWNGQLVSGVTTPFVVPVTLNNR